MHQYEVTRRQLPQRAGPLGLNGGGAAAAVPHRCYKQSVTNVKVSNNVTGKATVTQNDFCCKKPITF